MVNKVYIIDDDEVSLYLTGLVFELYSPHTQCFFFDNATQALEHLQEAVEQNDVPALILLDLNMPVMSGFDFLEAIKPLTSLLAAKCSIFVLTSSVSEQDKLQAKETGMVLDLIQKPFVEERLAEINYLLANK